MPLLKDICEIASGYSFRGRVADEPGGTVGVVHLRDVDWGTETVSWDGLPRVTADRLGSHPLLQAGDILFGAKGQTNRAVLVPEVETEFAAAVAASMFFVVRVVDERTLPAYVAWFLNAAPAQTHLAICAHGSNMPSVSKACLGSVDVPLPPIDTQRRIAEARRLSLRERHLVLAVTERKLRLVEETCLRASLTS